MSFIRLKRVGKDRYAYLVDNVWTPKGPRQQVKRYLGKYLELEEVERAPLKRGVEATPSNLVTSELRARGFSEKLTRENIKVNLKLCSVKQGSKNLVLGINGGFLCSYTLRKLIHFIPIVEVVPGYALARAFSDAGIRVSREEFVNIYGKAYKRASAQ